MGKTVQITCDGCGDDITYRSNSVDYRLVLGNEGKPLREPGFVTDMMIYPAVERTHYFCDLGCLDNWSDRRRHVYKLWREWNDKWKAEHGTKNADGRVVSYPEAPQDLRESRNAEFEAAALAEYPGKLTRFVIYGPT